MTILAAILVAVGTQIPSITLDSLEQRIANGGDTVFVVNFWATWCKPCVEEIPAFEALLRNNAATPLAVVLVSVDAKDDVAKKVVPFVTKRGLRCEVVHLNEDRPNVWINKVDTSWSGAIPATLFVGRGRRRFMEQEFTTTTLTEAFTNFRDQL